MLESYEGGQYQPLKPEDIRPIHEVSVRLLEEVGVKVPNADVLEIFAGKGAPVDRERTIVRIPRSMLEDAVDTAPSSVVLCGREEKYDLWLAGRRTHLGTGGTVLNVLDLDSGQRRPATMDDLRQIARLVDAMENIQFYNIPAYPDGVPAERVDVNRFFSALTNTSKHVMGGVYTIQGIRDVVAMAEEIAGGREALRERPFISMITCVMSPLVLDETYSALEVEVARQGIPVVCPAEPLAGATSPVTLAGTVATSNAETLRRVWEQDGARDAAARAREKAREILAEHRPRPLEARIEASIRGRLGHLLL
ncbi:MAG: hypothetical protein D9V47_11770 [Clostridia bacterium]|nr:MAG: hypothetical protein D9V47_11770 [Clostridia bacterium]